MCNVLMMGMFNPIHAQHAQTILNVQTIQASAQTASSAHLTPPASVTTPTPEVQPEESWKKIDSGVTHELRGLSVVNDKVVWASGAKGTVLKTTDGETWVNISVSNSLPEAQNADFRDVHAFDDKHAFVLSVGNGKQSALYETKDGGKTWEMKLENTEPEGFWNCLDFWNPKEGLIMGDAVPALYSVYQNEAAKAGSNYANMKRFTILATKDGGKTWKRNAILPSELEAWKDEGAFAASGTCLITKNRDKRKWAAFVTGGAEKSRVFMSDNHGLHWRVATTDVPANAPPKGLYSIAHIKHQSWIAVGGDHKQTLLEGHNIALSHDNGRTWQSTQASPHGFLSVVKVIPDTSLVMVGGLAGTGVSRDAGRTWEAVSRIPINTIDVWIAKNKNKNKNKIKGLTLWAVGPKGGIYKRDFCTTYCAGKF